MTTVTLKLYASAFADLALILIATLSDFDVEIRIVTGCAGVILAILTSIKFVQDIKNKRIDGKLKRLDLLKKEEEFRRFMEIK